MAQTRFQMGDLISGGVLTGLGVYIVLQARGWDYLAPDGPGPGFFPIWYGIALIALSVVLMFQSVSRRAAAARAGTAWREVSRALGAWAVLAASIALLKPLGFLLSFALLTFVVVSLIYRRPLLHGLAAGVGGPLMFYLLFPLALNVALPVGVLGF